MLSSSRVELLALPYLGVDAALLEVEELVLPNLGGGRLVLHPTCSVSVKQWRSPRLWHVMNLFQTV